MVFNFFFRLKKFSPALVITWVTNPIHPKSEKEYTHKKQEKIRRWSHLSLKNLPQGRNQGTRQQLAAIAILKTREQFDPQMFTIQRG